MKKVFSIFFLLFYFINTNAQDKKEYYNYGVGYYEFVDEIQMVTIGYFGFINEKKYEFNREGKLIKVYN